MDNGLGHQMCSLDILANESKNFSLVNEHLATLLTMQNCGIVDIR